MKRRLICLASAILFIGFLFLIWLLDFPSWKKLDMEKLTTLRQTTMVYDAQDQRIAGLHSGENRIIIPINEVSEHVKNAFIAIEDARFYTHCGIDLWRIGGALISNIKSGDYSEGASTITQQLIKLTHLTSEKKLSRKAQEAWLAIQLEKRASKEEILGMYLNVVYFGRGAYGIETASQAYFGKSCREITLSEAAVLAGIIKAPGIYAPHISAERSAERRNLVLDAMESHGFISAEDANHAKSEPLLLVESNSAYTDSWYVDAVIKEAENILSCSAEEIMSGGFHIYTGMQPDLQQCAEDLFSDTEFFPGDSSDGVKPEAALFALNPNNGEVLCIVGGRNYSTRRGLNRALDIHRQPGSALKPISVYAAAIDYLGYTPISLLNDASRDFGSGYTPSNSSGRENGVVTLRNALMRSMNLAAVDLITRTGIEPAIRYAELAGITFAKSDKNLSIALGAMTEGVSPAQLSAAYASLANGGYSVSAHTIRYIKDLYGNTIYEYTDQSRYVMSPQSAWMITDILKDTASEGTAKQLAGVGFPVAAKTGTVEYPGGGNRDAWIAAYTPNISLTVWMGYDRPDSDHILPEGTTGGTYPAKLAASFLKRTNKTSDGGDFPIPDGMTRVFLDGKALTENHTALLASERTPNKYLIDETLPNDCIPLLRSDLWDDPRPVEAVYTQTDSSGYPAISFIASDSHSEYLIIRKTGELQAEIGCVSGKTGEYLTFIDESIGTLNYAEYCIIARHIGFMEEGVSICSEPSPWAAYNAPSIIERFMNHNKSNETEKEKPIFSDLPE